MYNEELKAWISESYDETEIKQSRLSENAADPEYIYIRADIALEHLTREKGSAESVFLMKKAADAGYVKAAYAMGELYKYGWGVGKDPSLSEEWYEKAKALEGKETLKNGPLKEDDDEKKPDRKKEKTPGKSKKKLIIILAAAAAVVIAAAVILILEFAVNTVTGIVVNEDTQLIETTTVDEFSEALTDLINEYDDELVISGTKSTNRLLLAFEGEGIDLSDFPAATVIANGENYLVIQFETEEEAQECLEKLQNSKNIIFIEEDEYSMSIDTSSADTPDEVSDLETSGVPYTSSYTGYTYYTWGVEYLGYDRYASWIMTQDTQAVTVAVIDSGCEVWDEWADRITAGADFADSSSGSQGLTDELGHGTHVAGTILDCTQGLEVYVMPVRVFKDSSAADSIINLGIQYAVSQGVDVINMSLGGSFTGVHDSSNMSSQDYFINQAVEAGIVVVVAAGNEASDTASTCPAHIDECIVVGAVDSDGSVAYFSNYGDSVDVTAPGVSVLSYYLDGEMATLDGTSMATPHISALAAMMKLYMTDKTSAQIENYIKDYCLYAGDKTYYGEGIPWADAFSEW